MSILYQCNFCKRPPFKDDKKSDVYAAHNQETNCVICEDCVDLAQKTIVKRKLDKQNERTNDRK